MSSSDSIAVHCFIAQIQMVLEAFRLIIHSSSASCNVSPKLSKYFVPFTIARKYMQYLLNSRTQTGQTMKY